MDLGRPNKNTIRVVGDYIIGPRIGSGSFAQVWRSKHRVLGTEFAIKEIDKKHLNDNLIKEISILSNISHPNIIRLFEAIQCEERIYLVLEYCDGGDLGAYINRHGRVSQDVARHFMKQLAVGLQVLRENRLIHRDLKPQNLLLCGDETAPLLKIGDFGFARYLTDQGLADTLCGSPLYMAPEIIQNKRYDAKADLWSVGAILYQLVIGKPPFDGNSQLQLFQNILKSKELRFPEGAHEALHPDCLDLCRSLLRQNPVERITFEEFFNHRFLTNSRVAVESEVSSQISRIESLVLTDNRGPQLLQENVEQHCSSLNDEKKEPMMKTDVSEVLPNTSIENIRKSLEGNRHASSKNRVADSLESIEKGYVLVHSNFASMDVLTSSLGTSLKESGNTKACALAPNSSEQKMLVAPEFKEPPANFGAVCETTSCSGSGPVSTTDVPHILGEIQGLPVQHPSIQLQLLHQYLDVLSDLAREKLNENSVMESFSIELVTLAIWKEALKISGSWLLLTGQGDEHGSSSRNETETETEIDVKEAESTDLTKPSLASRWAERGFILACDRSEKLSNYLHDIDGAAEMPDAMEIIYRAALAAGRNGAADQLIGNRDSAAAMYFKSLLLLSFIVSEAPLLPLKPPFSLAPDDKQRLLKYIKNLESHLSLSPTLQPFLKRLGFNTP